MPTLTLFAGPNGSGKTTLASVLRIAGVVSLDPDAPLVAGDVDSPVAAGRLLIERRDAAIAAHQSFALETTLSGSGPLRTMRDVKRNGYSIRLVYVATSNVEINVERVRARVTHGGHDVPILDIRRRYVRSLHNLPAALAIADDVLVFDNSGDAPILIAARECGIWAPAIDPLPNWFANARYE